MKDIINFLYQNKENILNISGTLLVAISFGSFPEKKSAPYTTNGKGGKKYIAYFNYPSLFYAGLILLIVGFSLGLKF